MGDAMKVRFSVLMPVYNREKYVRQAIDSVLSQTFTDHELLVVDDGSTDGSAEVLKSYGTRIRLIQQRNQGPEVARNAALALAQGEYVVLLDSDDFLFPYALATYDQIIRTFNSPPVLIGSLIDYRDGQPIPAEALVSCPGPVEVLKFQDYLSKTIPLTNFHSTLVIWKSVLDQVGGFRKSTPQTFHNEDLNTMLMVGTYGPCIVVQKPHTVAYRLHEENSIRNVKAIADGMLLLARSERLGQYPGGSERRSDRYAVIGGRASTWALRYCWRGGQRKLALQLLFGTAPMVFAAVWKKSLRYLRKPAQPIALPEE
jgi:glycosyltransferase involved in cell wall biosynthesis